MTDPMRTPLKQHEESLRRLLLLLLVLATETGSGDVLSSQQVIERVDGYLDLQGRTPQAAWDVLTEDSRRTTRSKLTSDVRLLRDAGYGIESVRGVDRGYRLTLRPLVPLSLEAQQVQDVVQIVATQRAATVNASPSVRAFTTGIDTHKVVAMRRLDGQGQMDVEPGAVVLTSLGRWLGIGHLVGTTQVWTFRLEDRWVAELTETPVAATQPLDEVRAVNPLTWGPHVVLSTDVDVQAAALARARWLLGPAIVAERPPGEVVRLHLEVSDARLLLTRLLQLRTSVTVNDRTVRQDLRDLLAAALSEVPWPLPTTNPAVGGGATKNAQPAPAQQTLLTLNAATLPSLKGRSAAVARASALTFALALLEQQPVWTAPDLAARLSTNVATLDAMLSLYLAAESDLANRLWARSSRVRPFRLVRDTAGVKLLAVHAAGEDSDSSTSLGRYPIDLDLLLTAAVAALEQLATDTTSLRQASLQALVGATAESLGLTLLPGVPQQDGEALTHLAEALARAGGAVPSELGLSPYTGKRRPGAACSFDYVNPWTGEGRRRTVRPLTLRRESGQLLLDALDLDLVAESGSPIASPAEHTRTFLVAAVSQVRDETERAHPFPDADHELYVRYARQDVLVTLAIDPEGGAVAADLERGWGAKIERDIDGCTATVLLHAPVEERLVDLILAQPAQIRLLHPEGLAPGITEGLKRLIAHHT